MAKVKTQYQCQQCQYQQPTHLGKCPQCQGWNTFVDITPPPAPTNPTNAYEAMVGQALQSTFNPNSVVSAPATALKSTLLSSINASDTQPRFSSGFGELDRVLGGGFLAGAYILVGGDPGIGKSTLMLQVAGHVASQGQSVLYVSGEESQHQLKHRAERLANLANQPIWLLAETKLSTVIEEIIALKPTLLIVDSIQALNDSAQAGTAGSSSQIKACAMAFMHVAKQLNITTLLVGHVTKEGQLGGPKLLEHMVDCVLYFEGEQYKDLRLLRVTKNRFGSTHELGVFEMVETGLNDVANPSKLFLGDNTSQPNVPGCVTICTMEGTRPLLVELQALAGQSTYASPRRVVNGIETNRLHQIVAVLERRLGLSFAQLDLYVNVVGGLRVDEPAADLGIALALVTSLRNLSLKPGTVLMGEIGLTGEIRPVRKWRERLQECSKIGFKRVVLPMPHSSNPVDEATDWPAGLEVCFVSHLREALTACLEAAD
jgi:DNA repair protein RadA/Sms